MGMNKADIFNLALSHLGITEFVTDPEDVDNTHANFLRRFWDYQVRIHFESGDWAFARTYYALGVPTGEESPFEYYPYIYQWPPKCLIFRKIHTDVPGQRISWLSGLTEATTIDPERRIYTTIESAVGVYTMDVMERVVRWDWAFGAMIAARLAWDYAGVRKPKAIDALKKVYADARSTAMRVNAHQQGDLPNANEFWDGDYVSARG